MCHRKHEKTLSFVYVITSKSLLGTYVPFEGLNITSLGFDLDEFDVFGKLLTFVQIVKALSETKFINSDVNDEPQLPG